MKQMITAKITPTPKRIRPVTSSSVPTDSGTLGSLNEKRGRLVRSLLRQSSTVALATKMSEDGAPYASMVLMANDARGRPLLLLSDLAVHSRNVKAAPKISLLVTAPGGEADPLTEARASLEGRLDVIEDAAALHRYLRRYPSANDFAAFADFHLYRMEISRAHLVAGFGEIHWVPGNVLTLDPDFLGQEGMEEDILDHMNADHADAVALLFGANEDTAGEVMMCGLDREGFDLRRGWEYKRILFDAPVSSSSEVRSALVKMVKNARN